MVWLNLVSLNSYLPNLLLDEVMIGQLHVT